MSSKFCLTALWSVRTWLESYSWQACSSCVQFEDETACWLAKSLRRQFERAWWKITVNTTGVVFAVKSPGVIVLPTGTRLSITGNLSTTIVMIVRNYGGSYTKSYIDPTALLCPLVNPQSHWLIILLHISPIKSWKFMRVSHHLSPVTWYIPLLTLLN